MPVPGCVTVQKPAPIKIQYVLWVTAIKKAWVSAEAKGCLCNRAEKGGEVNRQSCTRAAEDIVQIDKAVGIPGSPITETHGRVLPGSPGEATCPPHLKVMNRADRQVTSLPQVQSASPRPLLLEGAGD